MQLTWMTVVGKQEWTVDGWRSDLFILLVPDLHVPNCFLDREGSWAFFSFLKKKSLCCAFVDEV